MKKIYSGILILAIAFVLSGTVFAESVHNFEGVQEIINNKTSCTQLSDDQLERVGDYYMEQMHPGEAHELMDNMMGGDGSEELRNVHIFMAKRLYCGETNGNGMMGMMMGNVMPSQGGMSPAIGMMGFGSVSSWLTRILLWVLLGLGIASFIKYLSKK